MPYPTTTQTMALQQGTSTLNKGVQFTHDIQDDMALNLTHLWPQTKAKLDT